TQAIITDDIQIPENLDELTSIELSNDDKKNERRQYTLTDTVPRTNSDLAFPSSSTRYFIVHEGNLIEQESNNITNRRLNSIVKRQSTIDDPSYSLNQNELTRIHQTSRRQEKNDRHTESHTSNIIQLASGIQLLVTRSCLNPFGGQRIFECLKKRENYSLYLFSPWNSRLRKVFQRLIVQKAFDYLILFFIALSCITLAMERPSISPISFVLVASGLIFGPNTYLHTGWNVIHGFLVIISVVDFVINRTPGLKLVVQALLSSLRPIGHIVIVCCIFFIIFGNVGVQLFKGKFYYCQGPLARDVITRQQCEAMPDHRWQNQQYNFDNLGQALLTLFVLSSKDGWVQIMYNAIDAVDVEMQPIRNYSEA
ncbi:unnamed protein product, partial [Rotaria sp. Silwood2]